MTDRPPDLEVHEDEEWSALYVDGKLDRVGDHYLADERIRQLCGVRTVQDDAFMRGQSMRDGVAKTLDEVKAYARDRAGRKALARALREKAADLVAEASTIEKGE